MIGKPTSVVALRCYSIDNGVCACVYLATRITLQPFDDDRVLHTFTLVSRG